MRAAGLPVSIDSSKDPARSQEPTLPDSGLLSSIISSLDTLAPLSGPSPDLSSDNASRRSRPLSSSDGGTIASGTSPRLPSTAGFGVEYGNGLRLEEDDEAEDAGDAALPPTVRTGPSRRPYSTSRTRLYSSSSANAPLRLVPDSPRSSLTISSADRQAVTRNKLSAESWVRKSAAAEESEMSRGRSNTKNARGDDSQELIRRGDTSPSPTRTVDAFVSRPTTASSSKGRLYIRDSTINEDWPLANPAAPRSFPVSGEEQTAPRTRSSPDNPLVPALVTPPQTASTILDSIPTRTSSLREPSVSPAPSRRKKDSRRKSPASKEPKPYKPSKQIPESKWIGLGEENETVKRIRQLEQRKSQFQNLGQIDSSNTIASLSSPNVSSRTTPSSPGFIPSPTSRSPPDNIGASAGIQSRYGEAISPANGASRRPSLASGPSSPIKQSLEFQTPPLPTTSSFAALKPNGPGTPKLSLDSSVSGSRYNTRADAVRTPSREDLELSPLQKNKSSLTNSPPPPLPPFQVRPLSKKGRKSMSEKHPDLPSNLDRRWSRRKSMADPRYARVWEEGIEQARRDSIDTAVLSYLEAPRLSQTVRNSVTGRTITFSEVGDPDGAAVFVCVGMGLTRFITAFYDELAATLRLRLITVDRPGVGGSQPYPTTDKSGPLSWPGDLLIICQELGITRFSLLAHSAGAVYALATALILPHMINGKVHLLAPWIPPSQLEVISHPTASTPPAGALPRSQRILRALPTPLLKAANIGGSSASLRPPSKRKVTNQRPVPQFGVEPDSPEQENITPADERPEFTRRESMMLMDQYKPATNPTENFPVTEEPTDDDIEPALRRGSLILSATATPTDPSFTYASKALNAAEHTERERQTEYTSRLTESTWTLATRDSHPTVDLVVCLERNRDVGFRYTDVERDVVIHHGAEDKRVPLRNVKWIAEQMNRRADHRNSVAERNPPESRDSWADASTKGSCEVRVLNGEGHGLMASPSIMSDVLTEIASYWIGQDRGRIM